ncbi:hypothetical protein V7112_12555 [Bacillus sp. JJ1566]|uniref:hypothetical protein n=1 Tax=Bacillus sp. JJ1566 TaxID=3122961 RepID=UPI0030008C4A
MKRYWKILTLCFITVLVLGTFYIQTSLAAEDIRFELEKVSGDENEVKNLKMNVSYAVEDLHQSFIISEKEAINLNNQSVFKQLTNLNTWTSLYPLVENHKQFMRGKHLFPNSFYEDQDLVVYVNIEGKSINSSTSDLYFDIEVLDKKSEETTSMTFDLPNHEKYHWFDIMDIQIVNGELKVIARGSGVNGGEDLIVYTVDVKNKKMTNEELIYSSPEVKNGWSGFRVFNDYYSSQPEQYLIFLSEAYEHEDSGMEVELANNKMVYDIKNNKMVKMDLPEDFTGDFDNSSIVNSTIMVPVYSESGVKILQYDIETGNINEKQTFGVVNMESDKEAPYIKIRNEKVYTVESTEDGHYLSISDINTGESLYEGKIIVKNKKTEDYKLYFYEIQE